jgi:hypothetical protein
MLDIDGGLGSAEMTFLRELAGAESVAGGEGSLLARTLPISIIVPDERPLGSAAIN